MRRLTASTTEGREWSCNHNEATQATIGDVWAREQSHNVVFSVSSSGAIRPVRAVGRVDVEQSVWILRRKEAFVGSEHRLL